MKYKTYNEYLLSDKWDSIKNKFTKLPNYEEVCFLCFCKDSLQCHHWRYEKDWNKDKPENLILLCEMCHKSVHSTKLIHDSHMYKPDQLHLYISHLIKDMNIMEIKHFELLGELF